MKPRFLAAACAAAALSLTLPAQQVPPAMLADGTPAATVRQQGLPGKLPGTERWLVTFKSRSFDLEALRLAIWNDHPVGERQALVARYEQQMRADQAPFVEAVERLGGRVTDQWWIVNGCAVEVPPSALGAIRAMANVDRLDPDAMVYPQILKATNSANHNSDAVNALGYKGLGVVTAIVDTGQDENMFGSGKPHQTYYPEGDKTKTSRLVLNRKIGAMVADDVHDHGTGVAGIVAGGKWGSAGADHGHAPLAGIAGYAIADTTSGGSNFTTIVNAWNAVLNDKAVNNYRIVSANNSYSGTSDPLHVSQQALDACALNGDILVVVAAGNNAASTTSSQSCANGLAVAALNADTHTVATFSSRGPLAGDTTRFYPDIAGCGVNTVMPKRDNEASNYVASGTSMASPQVCGAVTLLRGAVPALRADETKAILLASALDISAKNPAAPYNSRNAYGMGLSKDDAAMQVALDASKHGRATLTTAAPVFTQPVILTSGKTYRFAIAWMRQVMTQKTWADLTLEILDGTTVVASSATPRNLYELAALRASRSGAFTMRVTATAFETGTTKQELGWAWTEGIAPPVVGTYTAYGAGCKGSGTVIGNGDVLPAAMRTAMGNSNNYFPFGRTNMRYQQMFLESEIPQSTTYLGLSLRQSAYSTAGGSQAVQMFLGYSSLTPATMSATYDSNFIANTKRQVFNGTLVIPPLAGTNTDPTKFATSWVFTSPFPFAKTAGRNLLLEVVNTSTADLLMFWDAVSGNAGTTRLYATSATAATGTLGTSYGLVMRFNTPGGAGAIPVLGSVGAPELGKSFQVTLSQAAKNAAAPLFLGASRTQWLFLTLPFDLTPFGGTGCSLLASVDLVLPVASDANGAASVPLGIPNDKALISVAFFNQFLIVDKPANSLGLVLSNGGDGRIGGQP